MFQESEDEDAYCFLDVELEALHSIYINELEVTHGKGKSTTIAIQLHPSTADNIEEQYVRLSLIFDIPVEYPDKVPEVLIKNPRGLSDEKLDRITQDLVAVSEERRGGTMLFELIECAKDHLTAGNRPSCQCAICLHGFTAEDVFTKTKCYHYFHSHCLARYVKHHLQFVGDDASQNESQENVQEVLCPVCRIPISFGIIDEDFPPPFSAKEDNYIINDASLVLREEMKNLFEKQKAQGGIIDVEAEKNKYLLEISTMPSAPSAQDVESEENLLPSVCGVQNDTPISTETKVTKDSLAPKNLKNESSTQNRSADRSNDDNRPHRNRQKGTKSMYVRNLEGRSKKQSDYRNKFSSNRAENFTENSAFRQSLVHNDCKKVSPNNSKNVLEDKEVFSLCAIDTGKNNFHGRESIFEINTQSQNSEIPQHDFISTTQGESQQSKYSNSNRFQNKYSNADDCRNKYSNSESFQNQFHRNRGGWQNNSQHRDFHKQRNRGGSRNTFREYERPVSSSQNTFSQNAQIPLTEDECQKTRQRFNGHPRYHSRNKHFGVNKDNAYRHNELSNKSSFDHKKHMSNVNKTRESVNDENIPACENLRIGPSTNKSMAVEKCHDRISEVGENDTKSKETQSFDRPYRPKSRGYRPCRNFPVGEKKALSPDVKEHSMQSQIQDQPQRYELKNKRFSRKSYNESSTNSYRGKKNFRNIESFETNGKIPTHEGVHNHQDLYPLKDIKSQASDLQPRIKDSELLEGKNYPIQKANYSLSSSVPPPPGFTKRIVYGLPSTKPPPGFDRS